MGQRHQLFIIAKIGSRYRCLAAVHHQWLYECLAVAACVRILQTFQVVANRKGIRYELADASTKPEAFWNDAEASYNSHWNSPSVPFPFIMTCLVIAASFVVEPPHNTPRISPEPFGMPYDGGDNNDGITVIDITQPENLRYCFVFVNGSERGDSRNTPLSEKQYLEEYRRRDQDNDDEDTEDWLEMQQTSPPATARVQSGRDNDNPVPEASGRLAAFEVLHIDCLKSAWPAGHWEDFDETALETPTQNKAQPADPSSKDDLTFTTSPYSAAFRHFDIQPGRTGHIPTAPSLPVSRNASHLPLTQLIIGGQIQWDSKQAPSRWAADTIDGFEKILAVYPVADAQLTSTTLLTTLRQFLVFLSDMDFYHNFPAGSASATCFAKCIATAPQTLAESLGPAAPSTVAIQPLPPHLYSVGKALSHIQWRKIPLDTIRYGEWTLLILNNLMLSDPYDPKAEKGLSASSLSYCFVTAKHPVAYPYMSIPAERTITPEQFEFHGFTSFLHTFDMKPGARASLLDFWGNQMCARMKTARTSMRMIPEQDICDIFGALSDPKNYDPLLWRRMMQNEDPARTQPVDEPLSDVE